MSAEKLRADIANEQCARPLTAEGCCMHCRRLALLNALLDEHEEASESMLPGDNNAYKAWFEADYLIEKYGEGE